MFFLPVNNCKSKQTKNNSGTETRLCVFLCFSDNTALKGCEFERLPVGGMGWARVLLCFSNLYLVYLISEQATLEGGSLPQLTLVNTVPTCCTAGTFTLGLRDLVI